MSYSVIGMSILKIKSSEKDIWFSYPVCRTNSIELHSQSSCHIVCSVLWLFSQFTCVGPLHFFPLFSLSFADEVLVSVHPYDTSQDQYIFNYEYYNIIFFYLIGIKFIVPFETANQHLTIPCELIWSDSLKILQKLFKDSYFHSSSIFRINLTFSN